MPQPALGEDEKMDRRPDASGKLAAKITRASSKQTYSTIRLFADRDCVEDAYRAYAYFRWVDDILDADSGSLAEKLAFIDGQRSLLEACYLGQRPQNPSDEECMLADLIADNIGEEKGLAAYLRNMMAVMEFDARRRGEVISQADLSEYSRMLAVAVTEALYYFIGHDDPTPWHEARYLAVTAAHITHMLRDTCEDVAAGYYNIPAEYLRAQGISAGDFDSPAFREWVCGRVKLAQMYFKASRDATSQVRNWRCRLAGFAYTSRFKWILRAIERDCYSLRAGYPERKGLRAGLWMAWRTLGSMVSSYGLGTGSRGFSPQPVRIDK
jgi:phytoene/squalene synthetase